MPALINALLYADGARLKNTVSQAAASGNDASIDLGAAGATREGVLAFVQQCGSVTGTLAGKIQHSDDDSTYTDVTGGGFTSVAASNNLQILCIDSKNLKRYVRYAYAVVTGPVLVSVALLSMKKSR